MIVLCAQLTDGGYDIKTELACRDDVMDLNTLISTASQLDDAGKTEKASLIVVVLAVFTLPVATR